MAEVLARGVVIIDRFFVTNWGGARRPFAIVIGLAIVVALRFLLRR